MASTSASNFFNARFCYAANTNRVKTGSMGRSAFKQKMEFMEWGFSSYVYGSLFAVGDSPVTERVQ